MQPLHSVQPVQPVQLAILSENTLFLTVDQAATLFGYSADHIRKGVKERRIPGIKVGGSYRVSRSFVEKVVAEMEAGRFVDFDDFAAAQLTHSEVAS
jgi:excisionase family DNA binding protein